MPTTYETHNIGERQHDYEEIMAATANDQQMLHKLIRKQRSVKIRGAVSIDFTQYNFPNDSTECNKWAKYYEDLATPKDNPTFDNFYHESAKMRRLIISSMQDDYEAPETDHLQTLKDIMTLKNNKAPDIFGIAAEHLKLADMEQLLPLITYISKKCFNTGKLPDTFKIGAVTPVPKKDKMTRIPDKFRRITVSSLTGKIVEKQMTRTASIPLNANQSKLQFGFTEKVSPSNAAVMITEAIAENRDKKMPTYITYLDASKCFDVVNHDSMLCCLYEQGVRGKTWKLFENMYTGITSQIKWKGELSNPISEGQGIRQGAQSSSHCFKSRANKILYKIEDHPASLRIGTIRLGGVMVADDLAVMSNTVEGLQQLVFEAECDASRERYTYNIDKTRVQVIKEKKSADICNIKLNNNVLKLSTEETHVGIQRTSDGRNIMTVEARLKTARRTSYALMGAGLYGLNGTGPEVARHLWKIYIIPRLTYGLEALNLTHVEIKHLEKFYLEQLRYVQYMHKTTANAAVYLLIGLLPIQAQLDIKILCFFVSMLRRTSSIERKVFERQLAMKNMQNSHSWTVMVRQLLLQYGLCNAYDIYKDPPSKITWKRMVTSHVTSYWESKLKEEAAEKSSLCYLNIEKCSLMKVHHVWRIGAANQLTVTKASIHARLLTQRYPLHTNRTSGSSFDTPCPLCHGHESMSHFILECSVTEEIRKVYLEKLFLLLLNNHIHLPVGNEETIKLILDPTNHYGTSCILDKIMHISRDMCYHLHQRRSHLISRDIKIQ